MNCCVNCFNSEYLISIINADDRNGNCDFCNSISVSIYAARELAPFFRNIISLYEVDVDSEFNLAQSVKKDFNLTTNLVDDNKLLFESILDNLIKNRDIHQLELHPLQHLHQQ